MCAHQRLRSACANAQADLSLRWMLYGYSQGVNLSSGQKLRLWTDCEYVQTDLNLRCTYIQTCTLFWIPAHHNNVFSSHDGL